jgi:hypothetical protein
MNLERSHRELKMMMCFNTFKEAEAFLSSLEKKCREWLIKQADVWNNPEYFGLG